MEPASLEKNWAQFVGEDRSFASWERMKKEEKKINSFLLASEGKHRIYLLGQTQDEEEEEYKKQNVGRGTRNHSNSRKKGVVTAVDECMLPK